MNTESSWVPTKKWLASLVVGAAGIVASVIESGAFDDAERGMLGSLVLGLVAAYFKSNDPTPTGDGVPGA